MCFCETPAKLEWHLHGTKSGHRIVENVAHEAGFHSLRWEVTQRSSKAGTVKICHRRRGCRNDTEYSDRSSARLQLQFFDQSFASSRRIKPRVYGVQSTQVLKTSRCLIVWFFLKVYSWSISFSRSIHRAVALGNGFTELGVKSAPTHKRSIYSTIVLKKIYVLMTCLKYNFVGLEAFVMSLLVWESHYKIVAHKHIIFSYVLLICKFKLFTKTFIF